VPPIYQPEVAAHGIVWSSEHRRRELWVGYPTTRAIIADKIAPGLLDRYLGKVGYEGQQTDEPQDPEAPHNLWEPVPGDFGAHGRFDDRAMDFSPQLWLTVRRGWIAAGAGVAAGVAALALWRR
jgi:hypothetical protein